MTHDLLAGLEPTEDEAALIKAVSEGRAWNESDHPPTPEQLADAAFVAQMPVIRAGVIRALCLGHRLNDAPIDPKGIEITGAKIDGTLDLSFAKVSVQLILFCCHIAERPNLRQAHFPLLSLSGSRLEQGLTADRLKLDGSLFCRKGFRVFGRIRLVGANIGGNAEFDSAFISNNINDKPLLDMSYSSIGGNILLREKFKINGGLKIRRGYVGGNVEFNDVTLDAININQDSKADFSIDLSLIEIKGNLLIKRSKFNGRVFYIENSHILKDIDVLDSDFLNKENFGLIIKASSCCVMGCIYFKSNNKFNGELDFSHLKVAETFEFTPEVFIGFLNLSYSYVGQWKDNWCEALEKEKKSRIDIKNFTYNSIVTNDGDHDVKSRIAWISASLGGDFAPGPYETLTRALRVDGDDGGANEVAYAKRVDRAKHRAKPLLIYFGSEKRWRRTDDFLLDVSVGHGYKPWRGFAWLVGLLLFGWLFFGVNGPMAPNGSGNGVIKPAVPVIFGSALGLGRCGDDLKAPDGKCPAPIAYNDSLSSHAIHYALPIEYTPFSPFWYSLDTLIPLVDLGQESAWSPSPIDASFYKDPWGWFVLIYLYIHIIFGWLLTTLTVVALSGIIKKREP